MYGLTFVGVPKEILQHSYGELPVILGMGRLVLPHTPWHATIFETMNMGYELPISSTRCVSQTIAFLANMREVFYSENPFKKGWRVMLNNDAYSVRQVGDMHDICLRADSLTYGLDADKSR